MQPVTKEEKEWLIENNLLQMEKGRYPDLTLTGKRKRKKKYYVPDYLEKKVKLARSQNK